MYLWRLPKRLLLKSETNFTEKCVKNKIELTLSVLLQGSFSPHNVIRKVALENLWSLIDGGFVNLTIISIEGKVALLSFDTCLVGLRHFFLPLGIRLHNEKQTVVHNVVLRKETYVFKDLHHDVSHVVPLESQKNIFNFQV
jgi:hypothetical protein